VLYKERKKDLEHKKKQLDDIIAETEKEEKDLQKKSDAASKHIEERLLSAYHRVRTNARNGLAVVAVQRGSCGGCFNAIPPQRQLDISSHKKIIVCEHCGRILVDDYVVERVMGEK
jgi:predicted  nucleic acid-binding Zn-ribbon protein